MANTITSSPDEREHVVPDVVPPRTRTLPEQQRGPWFDGPDVVTMLRVFGTDLGFELPRDLKTFSIGSSPDRDIAITTEFVSALHCIVERRGCGLRVHDQGSHNGTFFGGRRETMFDLRPGDTFTVASVRFLAMNDEMRASYPVLADIVGEEHERSPYDDVSCACELIVAATYGGNLLVTGEPGCDQDRLARTIHEISLRRGRDIVEIDQIPEDRAQQRAIIDRAARSTLVLSIGAKCPVIDPAFGSMICSPSFHIRIIALAPTISKANDVLGNATVRRMQHVPLQPLARRRGSIHSLLDGMFAERGATLRVSDLSAENQAALRGYAWPDNLIGLRLAVERLNTIERERSLRKASDALGVSTSTLHYWFNQLGLTLPLRVADVEQPVTPIAVRTEREAPRFKEVRR
jgi:hypothetical protein